MPSLGSGFGHSQAIAGFQLPGSRRRAAHGLVRGLIFLLLAVAQFVSCARMSTPTDPTVSAGSLDLSRWDRNRTIELNGPWQFFWKEFLVSAPRKQTPPPVLAPTPRVWNEMTAPQKGGKIGAFGYATYRLTVSGAPQGELLGVKFQHLPSAFVLYANGKPIATRGRPATEAGHETPQWLPGSAYFASSDGRVVLDLEISNWSYGFGGVRFPLRLGTAEQIKELEQVRLLPDLFLFGCAAIMGLYHLSLFALRREDRRALTFGLFCLTIAVNLSVNGEFFLVRIFPDLNWTLLLKIIYTDLFLSLIFLMAYVEAVFPKETPRRLYRFAYAFFALFAVAGLIAPVAAFSRLLPLVVLSAAGGLLVLPYVAIRALLRRREGARLFSAALGVLLFAAINDLLLVVLFPGTLHIIGFALFLFIFAQAFLLSRMFARAFRTAEELSRDLEQRVELRTAELHASNAALQRARDELWGEMELAKRIQTVLLPPTPAILGYDIVAYMEPAEQVGGDYYDIVSAAGVDWVVIGDVSGHGVPAGLIMMMVQTAIHTAIDRHPHGTPADLLASVNRVIYENIRRLENRGAPRKYMTITALSAGPDGRFFFSGQHQDIIIHRSHSDQIELRETSGMWLGVMPDIVPDLDIRELTIGPGDTMLLYTDGITEAFAPDGSLFSDDRLVALMEKADTRSLEDIRAAILEALREFRRHDDVTFVLIRRTSPA